MRVGLVAVALALASAAGGVALRAQAEAVQPGVSAALRFDGVNDHVTFGNPASLGLATFTVETWFRRDGAGVATTTTGSADPRGFSSVTTDGVVPLVAKGRGESDRSNADLNYLLGIHTSGVLGADFEEGPTATPGRNHKILGTTPIAYGTWYHAAVTYDGVTLSLYLDGQLERSATVAEAPRSDSIQHASLGSALNSDGRPKGYFAGVLDEPRIWNRALTAQELRNLRVSEVDAGAGLVARWGLNEGAGTAVGDSVGSADGTTRGGAGWTDGPGFQPLNRAPAPPELVAPQAAEQGVTPPVELTVRVDDPDGTPTDVTMYGRATAGSAPDPFTVVVLPDTQYYSQSYPDTYLAQAQWVAANRQALGIEFVAHVGDVVDDWDVYEEQWVRADAAHDLLDAAGIPYGVVPGNHDIKATGVGALYDTYFRPSRFAGQPWYLGYLGDSVSGQAEGTGSDGVDDAGVDRLNKNSYQVVQAGRLRLVFIGLEYDLPGYSLAWAQRVVDAQLAVDPDTEFVLVTHNFVNVRGQRPTSPIRRADGTSAEQAWNQLVRVNCNIHLVLNGHYHGEARRRDLNDCGEPVHQLLADYQTRVNGGDGWLRYLTFRPAEDAIEVFTYSPTLQRYETDAGSRFTLDYAMPGGSSFAPVGSVAAVPPGQPATVVWDGLAPGTEYEWFAVASDGTVTTTGPQWTFTTATAP